MVTVPYGLKRDEGTMVDYYGVLVTVKATAAITDGSFSLVEQWGPKGAAPPWHIHHPNDEMFLVTEGHITGLIRDEDGTEQQFPSGPGDMFYVPKGVEHAFVLDEESKVLVMTFRPGFEQYFVELGTPITAYELPPQSEPAEDKLEEIAETAARYGMEITGPPPV